MKLIYAVLLTALLVVSCGKKSQGPDSGTTLINGAGATFPYPIYSKWFFEYHKLNPNATINYQSIGSGGGVRQITEGTVDFGASDSPMSDEEMKKANEQNGNNNMINIPSVIGSVVLSYNIPEVKQNINLTQKAVVDIYMGKIKKWNDPEIANANPGVNLPDKEIIVCYRTDGSGTTFVFTDFLSKASEEWKTQHGTAKDVRFPVGQGGKGNEGVSGLVKQLAYSIGYIEYVYAIQNQLNFANVQNPVGEFVTPSLESLTKAAEVSVERMPDDLRQSITNASGAGAYPISSYTYLLIFQNQKDRTKGKILKEFLNWALTDGQKFALELGYAPLPGVVVQKAQGKVNTIGFNGQPL